MATNVGAPTPRIIWFAIDTDFSRGPIFSSASGRISGRRGRALPGQVPPRHLCLPPGFVCDRPSPNGGVLGPTRLAHPIIVFNGILAFRNSPALDAAAREPRPRRICRSTFNEANGDDTARLAVPGAVPMRVPTPTPFETFPAPFPNSVVDGRHCAGRLVAPRAGQSHGSAYRFSTFSRSPVGSFTYRPPYSAAVPKPTADRAPRQIAGNLHSTPGGCSGHATADQVLAQSRRSPPLDKVLGGEALVGVKTRRSPSPALRSCGFLQTFDFVGTGATATKATATGAVLTALMAAFGALGSLRFRSCCHIVALPPSRADAERSRR